MKLKKGDEIIVTSGKDKGKKGTIERTYAKSDTILVTTLNLVKKHVKKRDEKNPGGIVEIPRPIAVAKVSLVCPKCKLATRIGYKQEAKGKKRRCVKCKQTL